jgi:hypothetical protein
MYRDEQWFCLAPSIGGDDEGGLLWIDSMALVGVSPEASKAEALLYVAGMAGEGSGISASSYVCCASL